MLESWRYERAVQASAKCYPFSNGYFEVFLAGEYQGQRALEKLGVQVGSPVADLPRVDEPLVYTKGVLEAQFPLPIEVIGMPRAGKSSSLEKFVQLSWTRGQRHRIGLLQEAASSLRGDLTDLKHADPFSFNMLTTSSHWLEQYHQLLKMGEVETLLEDRGVEDRKFWRRALFSTGYVNPAIMMDEPLWDRAFERPVLPTAAVILCLVRPEISLDRDGPREKPGVIMNRDFLTALYEQYLRFHSEVISGQQVYPAYACLNMEGPIEQTQQKFIDTLNGILSLWKRGLA